MGNSLKHNFCLKRKSLTDGISNTQQLGSSLDRQRAGPIGRNIGDNSSSYHTGQHPVIAFLVSLIWQTEMS